MSKERQGTMPEAEVFCRMIENVTSIYPSATEDTLIKAASNAVAAFREVTK